MNMNRLIPKIIIAANLCACLAAQDATDAPPASQTTDSSATPAPAALVTADAQKPEIVGWWKSDKPTSFVQPGSGSGMDGGLNRRILRTVDGSGDLLVHWNPPMSYSTPVRVKWSQENKSFQGSRSWPNVDEAPEKGLATYTIRPSDDLATLSVDITLDKAAEKQSDWKSNHFDEQWSRSKSPFREGQGGRVESKDILLIETKDGMAAYSKSLGKWDSVTVGLPEDGRNRLESSVVGETFAYVIVNDDLYGFSSHSGRWSKLAIDKQYRGKVQATVGINMLSAKVGDQTYTLSPTTGEWTTFGQPAENERMVEGIKGDLESKIRVDQELARLTEEYNDLYKQRRFADAEVVAKKAEALSPENPVAETMVLKAQIARQSQFISELKSKKEQIKAEQGGLGGFFPVEGAASVGQPASSEVPATATESNPAAIATQSKKRIQGMGIYVVETDDGFAAYSQKLGRFDRVIAEPRKDGKPYLAGCTVGLGGIGTVVLNDDLYGFSSDMGRWLKFSAAPGSKISAVVGIGVAGARIGDELVAMNGRSKQWSRLKVPAGYETVWPTVGDHMVYTTIGNKTYVLSSTTGEWTSPDDPNASAAGDSLFSPNSAIDTSRRIKPTPAEQLTPEITRHEDLAAAAAAKVRQAMSEKGKDDPVAIDARRELDRELDAALDLRFKREELRVKELQSRLSGLQQQIGQRKAQRAAIIERRANELIENEGLKWDVSEAGLDGSDVSRSPQPASAVQPATDSAPAVAGAQNSAAAQARTNPGLRIPVSSDATLAPPSGNLLAPIVLDASIQEFANRLQGNRQLIANLENNASRLEKMLKQGGKSDSKAQLFETHRALKEAKVMQKLMTRQLAGAREDIELQIKAAKIDMLPYERLSKLAAGQVSQRTVLEAQAVAQKAELMIERLEGRLKLFDQIDELLKEEPPSNESEGPATIEAGKIKDEKQAVEILGFALGERVKLTTGRHREGLKIVVDNASPAFQHGLRTGDVLVGISKWETANVSNVIWILNHMKQIVDQTKQQSLAEGSPASDFKVGMTFVRDGEEKSHELELRF